MLCTSCEEEEEEIETGMIIKLDGWYNETFTKSLNGEYSSFSFKFRDKYKKLKIDECVHIEADSKRIYPMQQKNNNFIVDLTDVDELIIKSIHPGRDWVPYSREITLTNVIFNSITHEKFIIINDDFFLPGKSGGMDANSTGRDQ